MEINKNECYIKDDRLDDTLKIEMSKNSQAVSTKKKSCLCFLTCK